MQTALDHVRFSLLFKRRWAYLRYLHARQALLLVEPSSSVLVIGGGAALAEVALALEFPAMTFRVTDHAQASHNLEGAKKLIDRYEITNISFEQLDILASVSEPSCDVVYSVEVLEHIEDDDRAAANMRALARQFVFCLVPFADDQANADPARRGRVFTIHEHYVVGYDVKRLVRLFPNPIAIRGSYWHDAGAILRKRLTDMDVDAMRSEKDDLYRLAETDLRTTLPISLREAQGIWILSKIHA